MRWNFVEVYKCAILTVIAALLGGILWQMPPQPLTRDKIRKARESGIDMQGWQNKLPLVYVQDGNISVEDFETPLPVEVENTVEVEVQPR